MIAAVQRVSRASVSVDGELVSEIGAGLLVLLGVSVTDTAEDAAWLAKKIAGLRMFRAPEGQPERSVLEIGGEVLAVSQFTLLGNCRKGRRPSVTRAARGRKPKRSTRSSAPGCATLAFRWAPAASGR